MIPFDDRLRASLGDRYRIERELGGGGMSRVFVAEEVALRRRVVVKVLAPELSEGLSAERFAREIATVATLQSPYIVPVLAAGSGDGGDTPWYTMPFIDGETLRARVQRGAVPVGEAVGILRDIALALEHAHSHGVIHRDIKPENVLLSGRTAVVSDFGIAKALTAARTVERVENGGALTLTSVGQSIGTPAYMAPEQAAGDVVDRRADLYAWGLLAYELLTGAHPFRDRTTAQQMITAQLTQTPAAVSVVAPAVPPAVAALVMQCLAKAPEARPADAGALLAALESRGTAEGAANHAGPINQSAPGRTGTRALIAAGVVLALAGAAWLMRSTLSAPDAAARRLAVLSFENLGDSADAYFADGMTDAVRSRLTGLGDLEVIARASSAQYAGSPKTPKEIASELGARYLLTGTVRFAPGAGGGKRVQVSPALVEVGPDGAAANRWEQPFNADLADVFTVQGEIASQVAQAMRVALGSSGRAKLQRSPTRDTRAYDAYLRAEAAWNAGGNSDFTSLRRARALYMEAVALDSNIVEAWGALSRVNSLLYANTTQADSFKVTALAAAQHAMHIDSAAADGARALGVFYRSTIGDNERARDYLQRAVRAAPQDVNLLSDLANVLSDLGELEPALRMADEARALDPRNARVFQTKARLLVRLRRAAEAAAVADSGLALTASSLQLVQLRLMTDLSAGDLAAARSRLATVLKELPRDRVLTQLANYWDMGWLLEGADERDLMALGEDAFGGGRTSRASIHAVQFAWRGDTVRARAAADTARTLRAAEVAANPSDPQRRALLALAEAHAGRSAEALAAVKQARAILDANPSSRSSLVGTYVAYSLARAALAAGDKKQAFELLADAMKRRYLASPAWVRLDPSWQTVLRDPGFVRALGS